MIEKVSEDFDVILILDLDLGLGGGSRGIFGEGGSLETFSGGAS